MPNRAAVSAGDSTVVLSVAISGEELTDAVLLAQPNGNLYVPVVEGVSQEQAVQLFSVALKRGGVVSCTYSAAAGMITECNLEGYPAGSTGRAWRLDIDPSSRKLVSPHSTYSGVDLSQLFSRHLAAHVLRHIYAFRADRLPAGVAGFGTSSALAPDARNLPEVLNALQSNVKRFQRFNEAVRAVLPQLQQVTVRPVAVAGGPQLEVIVWSDDPSYERDDLAVPLAEGGTGVGHVLAILYVVLTADRRQVLILDEPQSFLHPGAARKLLTVLARYREHQYVIATHAPAVISATRPDVVLLVRKTGATSEITEVSGDAEGMRETLASVGARLSDVFGADRVLWVEGPTEEACYPRIVDARVPDAVPGTIILGVVNTGDFEGGRRGRAMAIYRRLSSSTALLPPAVGFLFDRERLSDRDVEDLERDSKRRMRFLERRMYENYLVHPEALAAVMSAVNGFPAASVTAAEVEAWIEQHRWDEPLLAPSRPPSAEDRGTEESLTQWLRNVHGAKLLHALFTDLSEQRVTYDKVTHGVHLTDWLLTHAPEHLAEVAATLRTALSAETSAD